jgi:Cellulase (glycosyl hydrolase family 5)
VGPKKLRSPKRISVLVTLTGGLVAGTIVALLVLISGGGDRPQAASRQHKPTQPGFHVDHGRIVAPDGRTFIVKGITAAYGTFAGGDQQGLGAVNYTDADSDFRLIRALGANTVRVFVTPATADPAQFARLRQVVRLARQQKLVVELANAFADTQSSLPWLRELARTFKDDPYVWLEPMNEPHCSPKPDKATCGDWALWQQEEREYVRAIRSQGMTSPIVVNTPLWSSSVENVPSYPLGDSNLVFGVHAYGNNRQGVTGADVPDYQRAMDSATGQLAVIVDEVGSWNGPAFANSFNWLQEFVDLVRGWVLQGGGSGAIGFVWRWSDPNTMVAPGGGLTPWGSLFVRRYLQPVAGER